MERGLANVIQPMIVVIVLVISQNLALSQNNSFSSGDDLGQRVWAIEKDRVMDLADQYWDEEPRSVTDWICDRSAGGPNDFYSEGDYWWPDPGNPEGPYIRKDGLTNPENFSAHRHAMIRMAKITGTMASAYLLTGEEKYVEKAMEHLRVWFIDTSTRMNPNLLYAQAIKGRYTGRGIGIIDAIHLVEPALAIKAMEKSLSIEREEWTELVKWFEEFLDWMYTHEYGMSEMIHPNNHGTYWAVQAAAYAYLTGNTDMLSFIAYRYAGLLLPLQMSKEGNFPLELERTKPYQYSIFNLDGMSSLLQILSLKGLNLYNYQTGNGKSLKSGMDFLFPFIRNKNTWPYSEDVLYYDAYPVRQAFLLLGALAYDQPEYLDVWAGLESDSDHPEVIRTTIMKFPLLWIGLESENESIEPLFAGITPDGSTNLNVPDGLWGNKGSIAFEAKFAKGALKQGNYLMKSPVVSLKMKGMYVLPELPAASLQTGAPAKALQLEAVNPDQWYHFTAAWDRSNEQLKLFINGVLQQEYTPATWDNIDFSGTLLLGDAQIEIRHIEILGGLANEEIALKLVKMTIPNQ